jgi:hypothetical protein
MTQTLEQPAAQKNGNGNGGGQIVHVQSRLPFQKVAYESFGITPGS